VSRDGNDDGVRDQEKMSLEAIDPTRAPAEDSLSVYELRGLRRRGLESLPAHESMWSQRDWFASDAEAVI